MSTNEIPTMSTTEERPQTPAEATAHFYPVIAPLIMCSGVGDGRTTACVMAQAATIDALRKGKTLDKPTDDMECACPVLRRLAIRANDENWWASNEERTEHLRPLIPLLLDSRGDRPLELRRIFHISDNCVRVLTPMRLEFIAEHTKDEKRRERALAGAKELRELSPITDKESANAAKIVCEKWRSEASADAYAYAYASASASAYAYAYAYASASTSASASASAYAYADADAYAQRVKYRTAYLEMFRECAALT